MNDSGESKKLAWLGMIFVLAGLVMAFFALYEEQILGSPISHPRTLEASAILLLEKVGLTFIVFGLLDLLLHLPTLNKHFLDGLRDLVIHDSYLKRLSSDRLTDLVNRAFQAQTGNLDVFIGREGSFLQYFHSNIRGFIQEPFREGAICEVAYSDLKDDPEHYHVKDILTYACRRVGKSIQKDVQWFNDPDEVEGSPVVSIWVQLANTATDTRVLLVDDKRFKHKYKGDAMLYDIPQEGKLLECSILEESLEKYSGQDGLIVRVEAEYKVKKNRFLYWQMSHLTKGATLTLRFPPRLEVQVVPFIQEQAKCTITKDDGYHRVTFNQWVLPEAGIGWKFNEQSV